MEAIVIRPENVQQLKVVKAVLKALNVPFEKQTIFPLHINESIKKGLEQYENGKLISADEFKKAHFGK